MLENPPTDPFSSLSQFGVVGAIVAALFVAIITPLIRAMLAQNNKLLDQGAASVEQGRAALELLRRSVDSQTAVVASYQRLELEHRETREVLVDRLDRQEEVLRKIASQ